MSLPFLENVLRLRSIPSRRTSITLSSAREKASSTVSVPLTVFLISDFWSTVRMSLAPMQKL